MVAAQPLSPAAPRAMKRSKAAARSGISSGQSASPAMRAAFAATRLDFPLRAFAICFWPSGVCSGTWLSCASAASIGSIFMNQ